jgi:hypothetical protein
MVFMTMFKPTTQDEIKEIQQFSRVIMSLIFPYNQIQHAQGHLSLNGKT